jgi:hypothetical protein
MDTIVTFNKVAEFLRNPPTMAPCPDIAKLQALCQHIMKALKQTECPQSFIHGWLGLTMAPSMYALLEPNAFVAPVNPGPAPVYTPFVTPVAIKMVNATFERDKNDFVSYKNINRACFRMLDTLVLNQYKASNTPSLIGWNATMSIQFILSQLEDAYGKQLAAALFANDTLFKSAFSSTEAPELLFYHIEQCQEIMTLGKLRYTLKQVIANELRLLMASQIFFNTQIRHVEKYGHQDVPGPQDVHS